MFAPTSSLMHSLKLGLTLPCVGFCLLSWSAQAGTAGLFQIGIPQPPAMPLNLGTQKLSALLPQPGQSAQVMKLGSRLAIVDLQKRVVDTGGSREALQKVLEQAAWGQVPSYDERLNISRAEFGKYLAFQPVLMPTGKSVKLNLSRDATRVTFGDVGAGIPLRGLSFDLKSGELRVPEGFSFLPVPVAPNTAPDRSLDIRGGYQWNLRGYSAETQNGLSGQLSLYQLGNGQTLLAFKRTSMVRGAVNEAEVLLMYSAK